MRRAHRYSYPTATIRIKAVLDWSDTLFFFRSFLCFVCRLFVQKSPIFSTAHFNQFNATIDAVYNLIRVSFAAIFFNATSLYHSALCHCFVKVESAQGLTIMSIVCVWLALPAFFSLFQLFTPFLFLLPRSILLCSLWFCLISLSLAHIFVAFVGLIGFAKQYIYFSFYFYCSVADFSSQARKREQKEQSHWSVYNFCRFMSRLSVHFGKFMSK